MPLTKEDRMRAIQNMIPKKPIIVELGGGYYYRCPWIKCNEDIKKWFNYCPKCGQKIDWSDEL